MLIDDIKSYINGRIAADEDLSTVKISIKEQYPYGTKPQPPEILLAVMDNVESEQATTFEGEQTDNVSLQIIVMTGQMSIGGKRYNAQKSSALLSQKLCEWFLKNTIKENMPKIINTRRVQWSNSIPYENGTTTYYSILRFTLTVNK